MTGAPWSRGQEAEVQTPMALLRRSAEASVVLMEGATLSPTAS